MGVEGPESSIERKLRKPRDPAVTGRIVVHVPPFVRSAPTPGELTQGGNDVLYEVRMLFNTAALLQDRDLWGRTWQQRTLYMATLESFLVHARSLIDFLCTAPSSTRRVQEKDIFAFDYCSDWQPQPWNGDEWKAISQQIVHMSYRRPEAGRNWEYASMLSKLKALIARFLDASDGLHEHVIGQVRGVLDGATSSVAHTPESVSGVTALAGPDIAATTLAQMPASVPTTTLIDPSFSVTDIRE
jgi:hypothetical protein